MPVFKRKDRMVSFRVSDEEYRFLQNAFLSEGARSISDYTRATLFQVLRGTGSVQLMEDRMNKLAVDLESLNGELQRLRRIVDAGSLPEAS